MLLRIVVALVTFSVSVAWGDPDGVRHADYYATLDPAVVKRPPSDNPLAPLPSSEATARLTVATPKMLPRPRRWGIFGAGVALFGIGYAADASLTYGFHHAPSGDSLVPVVGPLLQLGQHYSVVSAPAPTGDATIDAMAKSAAGEANRATQAVVTTGLVIDFAMQLAGVAMAIAGPLTHHAADHEPEHAKVQASPAGLRVTF